MDNRTSGDAFEGDAPAAHGQPHDQFPNAAAPAGAAGALERQWLGHFDAFAGLIQATISHSEALLRELAELRERAERELAAQRQDHQRQLTAQQDQHRQALRLLADELEQVRQQVAALDERINQTVGELDTPPSRPAAPTFTTPAPAPITPLWPADQRPRPGTDDAPAAFSPDSPDVTLMPPPAVSPALPAISPMADMAETPFPAAPPMPAPATLSEPPGEAPGDDRRPPTMEPPATAADEAPVPPADQTAASPSEGAPEMAPPMDAAPTAAEPAPLVAEPAPAAGSRPVMVLVHNVPRAAAALSLQRHLAALDYIDAVEAREFAEGILRLEVTCRAPLQLEDLRQWQGGTDLEPIHLLDDVIEVRLK